MNKKKYVLYILSLLVFSLLYIVGCGNGDQSFSHQTNGLKKTGGLSFSLKWEHRKKVGQSFFDPSAPKINCVAMEISTIAVDIYASNNGFLKGKDFPCSDGQGKVEGIPVQEGVKVSITGKDIQGTALYKGEKKGINIIAGINVEAGEITINSVSSLTTKINTFSLEGVSATINEAGRTIGVTLPFGTDVSTLVATFTNTGVSIKVNGLDQNSGITANDFGSPVKYTVTAANGTTSDYIVIVTVSANSASAITAFSLDGVPGTIDETRKTIAVTIPFGTPKSRLTATFATQGKSVQVNGKDQTSGATFNDFTNSVKYTVLAANGTISEYFVTVVVASNSASAITVFFVAGVQGTITEATKTVAVTVHYGTVVTDLVATFTTTGKNIQVGAIIQTSGSSSNDFSAPVKYVVNAANGTRSTYTVIVTIALNSAKAITAFSLVGEKGTIDELNKKIAVTLPFGSKRTNLAASFTTTGKTVQVGGNVQFSGSTLNDFTAPVEYTVTADDETKSVYTITVTNALSSEKAITEFSLNGVDGKIDDAVKTIVVTMPFGKVDLNLVATFTTTGKSVQVDGTVQRSGETENDFSTSRIYVVIAADNTTTGYTVTVEQGLNPAKAFSSFALSGVSGTISGTINEQNKTITVAMRFGTNVSNLNATFTTTGVDVKVGLVSQFSGTTVNDFTGPITYTVTAEDGSEANYIVSVIISKVPDTGLTDCSANVFPVPCPSPGSPFYGQDANYTINPPSYTQDLVNKTVMDNVTGLMWQREDDNRDYSWYEASGTTHPTENPQGKNVCGSLILGGFSDWRLPSVQELATILDLGTTDPAIDSVIFPGTSSSDYWSSTPEWGTSSKVFTVGFRKGSIFSGDKSGFLSDYVRCVRGEPTTLKSFTRNADGTVTDKFTGLVWQTGDNGKKNWEAALSYCENFSIGGNTDWRLPNVKELHSLLDYNQGSPMLDTSFFPEARATFYWSSTSSVVETSEAYIVSFAGGIVFPHTKNDIFRIRAVRCVSGGL